MRGVTVGVVSVTVRGALSHNAFGHSGRSFKSQCKGLRPRGSENKVPNYIKSNMMTSNITDRYKMIVNSAKTFKGLKRKRTCRKRLDCPLLTAVAVCLLAMDQGTWNGKRSSIPLFCYIHIFWSLIGMEAKAKDTYLYVLLCPNCMKLPCDRTVVWCIRCPLTYVCASTWLGVMEVRPSVVDMTAWSGRMCGPYS